MAKMKIDDFVKKAIDVEKEPTLYKLGTYMNKKSGKYLLCDCSGLIKGILWGYPNNGKYCNNNVKDYNANTLISKCSSVTTDFTKAKKGWLVWMNGHIGIYVGNGVVVEASPIWENGIQKTFCKNSGFKNSCNLKERKWTKCGKLDIYLDYTTTSNSANNSTSNYVYYVKYTGNSGSIVAALNSIKVDSSYKNREKIAIANNIANYKGTAAQNTKMLDLLKAGKLVKAGTIVNNVSYYKKYTGNSGSIVSALNAISVNSSYVNRKKIAEKNGIKNYKGTEEQNTKMLSLLKNGKLLKA